MKFLVCSTDEQTFELVVQTSTVVGIATRFVVPLEVYFDDEQADFELYKEGMAELGIELLLVV